MVRQETIKVWFSSVVSDCLYTLRQLRQSSAFTCVAVFTLALGIGANTAIFSAFQGVLLAPLPYSQPDRLVMIWENNPRFPRVWVSYPNFQDWQLTARSFEQIAAGMDQEVDLAGPGVPEHLNSEAVTSGFFANLGVNLLLGREFSTQEDQSGAGPVAVISNRLWRNRFGAKLDVLGKTVTLDEVDYTIVGVLSSEFSLGRQNPDVYTPLSSVDPVILNDRAAHDGIFAIARLRSGVSLPQSQAEMNTIQNRLDQLYPRDNRDLGIYVEPLKQVVVGDAAETLVLLLGAVGLVLLIAGANVANLLLIRLAARSREFAIRAALGASRGRVARQLLTESVLLSLAGACLGIVFTILLIKSALAALPAILPRTENIGVNVPVLMYTLVASVIVGIVFGLTPALKGSNAAPQAALKEGGHGSSNFHRRTQSSFVVLQVALTLVLLVGAGLLFRTIFNLWDVSPGFDANNVLTFKVGVSHSLRKTPASTRSAYRQLLERIRHTPGVQDADFTATVPLSGQGGALPFWLDSNKPESLQGAPRLQPFLTGPNYLRTMRIPLLQGRFLTPQDQINSQCVAVIDSVFSHEYFPDGKPIGHTITAGFAPFGPCVIVGVVGHVKNWGLNDTDAGNQDQVYYSLYQDPDQWVPINYPDTTIVVRTPLQPSAALAAIKAAIYTAGTEQPVYNVRTMERIVSDSMSAQRFPLILLGAFSGLALLLACVGIYGVVSYTVTLRIREIGIRIALGADMPKIFRLVLGDGFRLILVGLVVGAAAAAVLTRLLSSLLFGVSATDPTTFGCVSVLLAIVALLACYFPARRAMRVDPMIALRHE